MPIVAGQTLEFLPQRAAFWRENQALILSDVHLGKSAVFRHAGVPVPEGEMAHDLEQMSGLVRTWAPQQLIIVGDLCHASTRRSPGLVAAFQAWRAQWPELVVTLVRGNHDKDHGLGEKLGISVCPDLTVGSLHFAHDPAEAPADGRFTICGHLHPVLALPGSRLRAPCFWVRENQLILPSFGSFTGGALISLAAGEMAYAIADGRLHAISGTQWLALSRGRS